MAVTMAGGEGSSKAADAAPGTSNGTGPRGSRGPDGPPIPSQARRFLLRLDNGDLICDADRADKKNGPRGGPPGNGTHQALLLGVEEGEALGRVKHEDLLRALRYLDALRRESHEHATSLRQATVASKPSKKQKTGAPETPRATSPGGTVLSGEEAAPADWVQRCKEILLAVMDQLGTNLGIFDRPVDPSVVPDYHKVVKNPMDLGTIQSKLDEGIYTKPAEFCLDVRLVWYNCQLYNKKGDFVERSGSAASLHFEKIWGSSGMAESKDRSRRANAGLAANKFEPPSMSAQKKPKGTSSAMKASSKKGGKSSRASSKKAKAKPQMSREQMAQLAERLSQVDEDALQGVVNIIRERTQLANGDPEEEIELDIEALDNDTLWELDRYLNSVTGQAHGTPGAAWAGQDDSGSDSDSSTESDSDEE